MTSSTSLVASRADLTERPARRLWCFVPRKACPKDRLGIAMDRCVCAPVWHAAVMILAFVATWSLLSHLFVGWPF